MRTLISLRLLRTTAIAIVLGASSLTVLTALPAAAQQEACAPPVVVETAPPPLPVYDQPPVPAPGYVWTPGNWHWDSDEGDYYWSPGTWVEPPRPGVLWTPGYWGWVAGAFLFHQGYWGPHVGFYGGVPYGFGYTGEGYEGGHWDHGAFFYNRAVNNIGGTRITNVYNKTVIVNNTVNNISYNGGKGGIAAQPTAEQKAVAREQHFAPTPVQQKHVEAAAKDPSLFQKANHGQPPIAATARPGEFKGPGVAPAHAGAPAPANGAAPAAEEKKAVPAAGEVAPAVTKPVVEEKKAPAAGAPAPAIAKPPVIEEKKAPTGAAKPEVTKPAVEEKKPVVEEKKAAPEKKPVIEEKKPVVEEKKAAPEKKPVIEEKKAAPLQPHPAAPPPPHPAAPPPPHPAAAPPPPHPAAHAPQKPAEKKKE